jgi:hypothetical protein
MKKSFVIVCCILIACVAVLGWALGPKLVNMKSEYVTAGVICDTHAFVKKTGGQWPQSWQDLGSDDFSAYTRMRFDVDLESINKEEIMSAISPQSGKYLTYPHANADLEALFEEVVKQREEIRTKDSTVPPDGAPSDVQ